MIIIPTREEIKAIEELVKEENELTDLKLMEDAAKQISSHIQSRYTSDRNFIFFAGPGNNGGDALATARLLSNQGYNCTVYLFNIQQKLSPACFENGERLKKNKKVEFHEITSQFIPPKLSESDIIIDGLFGIGLKKPLTGGFAAITKLINQSNATVLSIDIPSGLFPEDNSSNGSTIIKATETLTIQQEKLAFFFPENQEYIGKVTTLDIGLVASEKQKTIFSLVEKQDIHSLLREREAFAHKGDFGHGLLIAGSKGMAGACLLAAKASLRSGIGLLTIHTPNCNVVPLQMGIPEAMVSPSIDEENFTYSIDHDRNNTLAIGPGLGRKQTTELAILDQIRTTNIPLIIDADALNALSTSETILQDTPKDSILTPHVIELERLIGKCANSYIRLRKGLEFSSKTGAYLLIKGAYSFIVTPYGKFYICSTGNPGMATAGSGDVLTGILLGLRSQGYSPVETLLIGTYLHGFAGDLAAQEKGEYSLIASDIIESLPKAFKEVQRSV